MQARYDDPVIGRFLSADPIGYQDQINLYAYVHNDPLNHTDPTGMFGDGNSVMIERLFIQMNEGEEALQKQLAADHQAFFAGAFAASLFLPGPEDAILAGVAVAKGGQLLSRVAAAKPVPNPFASKGGPAHQAKVDAIAANIEGRGMDSVRELKVDTPEGDKLYRRIDVAGADRQTGEIKEMHQIGRTKISGDPVSRERRALDDVERTTGCRPDFHD